MASYSQNSRGEECCTPPQIVHAEEIEHFLTLTLSLCPRKANGSITLVKFARRRSCVSIANKEYETHGLCVSDNTRMAVLKLKPKKMIVSGYYVDFITFDVKRFDVTGIYFTDFQLCSIYLRKGTLWIVQNSEIGVIIVVVAFLDESPVRSINRCFGTMDYWNPKDANTNVTEVELQNGFIHVALNSTKKKFLRKYVKTLKNHFQIPISRIYVVITLLDIKACSVSFEFYGKHGSTSKLVRTIRKTVKYEKRFYQTTVSSVSFLAAVRMNADDLLVLDYLSCDIKYVITIPKEYLEDSISFQFSANGRTLYVLGRRQDEMGCVWSKYVMPNTLEDTLKKKCLRTLRRFYSLDQLYNFDIPKSLQRELTFR